MYEYERFVMPNVDVKHMNTKIVLPVAIVVALVIGVVIGHFLPIPGGVGATSVLGKTTISEAELDSPIGSYTVDGKTENITARQVLDSSTGVDSAKQKDGTYALPSMDKAFAYARNQVILKGAEAAGFSASDDEISEYAKKNLQTDDYEAIGKQYGFSADATKELLRQAVVIQKYRESVITTKLPATPTMPTAPSDGKQDTATADYAKYIIDLAGDEWSADKNTWASTDGPYYKALNGYSISNDSATYEAALAAYKVAGSNYQQVAAQATAEWRNAANKLLEKSSVSIYSLAL